MIRIRFDGPPGPESGRFVEIENEAGKSIKVGEWVQEGQDWVLEISIPSPSKKLEKADETLAAIRSRFVPGTDEEIIESIDALLLSEAEAKTRAEEAESRVRHYKKRAELVVEEEEG